MKALIPWMEERRPRVLGILEAPLSLLEKSHGGTGKIVKKIGEKAIEVTREELEYNDLAFFFKNSPWITTDAQRNAVSVCRRAKFVRDDLAHLRQPSLASIDALIAEMDRLPS